MERPKGSARFELRLFGGPRLCGPDGVIHLSPTQRAFLTIIYGTGGLSRTRMADILWAERDSARTRHRIRQLLSSTRSRVGVRCVETERDMLRPSANLWCDLIYVQELLQRGPLVEAARAVESGLAPDALGDVRGRYEDWRDEVANQLAHQVRVRATAVWREATHEGAWDRARDAAEALYVSQPLDAQVVAAVIEARAMTGKVGSAEAAYAVYADTLGSGSAADVAVAAAIERVRRVREADNERDQRRSGPFVGRGRAMLAARSALDQVSAGRFAFALVAGEAGIGKSRLLEEVRREALMRGFRCLKAKAVELERIIPLNPLLDALDGLDLHPHLDALGAPWNAVINSVLPAGTYDAVVGALPPIRESGLSRRLLDSLAMLLERLALEQPTVLFLDDMHWADATTITALQFFQRRWTQGAFGIIAAARAEQIAEANPASKYFRHTDGLDVSQIHLGELPEEEALDLIRGIAGEALDEAVVRSICAFAGPHPLYLTELTRDLLSGQLRLPELQEDEVPIPVSLQQLLKSRLSALSASATRVARVLAVAARPLQISAIASLAGSTLDECVDCVEELQARRLVEVERDNVAVSHDLFRTALYKDIPTPRRAVLHRTLAEYLVKESIEPSPGELAIHFARAGEGEHASRHGWTAATRALDSGAMAEAALFYELVTETESDPRKRAEATAGLARALHLNRDIARANPLLEMAASRLRAVGDSNQARRMEIRRVEGLAEVEATTPSQLVDRLSDIKAEARAAQDWEGLALALDAELTIARLDGDVEGTRTLLTDLREVVARTDSPGARVVAFCCLALAVVLDDSNEALWAAEEAVRLASGGRPDQRLKALNRLLIVLYHRGGLHRPESEPLIREARELAEGSGDLQQRFSLECNLAANALDCGDLDQAEVFLARAKHLLGSSEATVLRLNLLINEGELALARGDYGSASKAFTGMERHLGLAAPRYAADQLNAGLGLCALGTGAISEARRREEEIEDAPSHWYYDPTTVTTFRARLLERRGKHAEAVALVREVANAVDRHLVLACLKLRRLQVELMLKHGIAGADEVAQAGLGRATKLGINQRAREFERLLQACRE